MAELPEGMRTGMMPPKEQESMGRNTVSPMTLDPLTWHLMLVLIATCAGYYLTNWLQGLFPSLSVPMFSVSMICGVILQMILKALKLTKYPEFSRYPVCLLPDDYFSNHLGGSCRVLDPGVL